MNINYENLDHFWAACHYLVLIIGIFIGGIWTLKMFKTLKTKHKAEADLAEVQAELAKKKVEHAKLEFELSQSKIKSELELSNLHLEDKKRRKDLFEQAVIDIQVDSKQEQLESLGYYCISEKVKITNKGNRNTRFDFTSPSFLRISEVIFDEMGNSEMLPYLSQPAYNRGITILRAGATIEHSYFINVDKKGIFIIEVWSKLAPDERLIDNKFRGELLSETYWTGRNYVVIK